MSPRVVEFEHREVARARRSRRAGLFVACMMSIAGCTQPIERKDDASEAPVATDTQEAASAPESTLPVNALAQTKLDVAAASIVDRDLRAAFVRSRQAEAGKAFHVTKEGADLVAQNPDHAFVTRYEKSGVSIASDAREQDEAWQVQLSLAGVGRGAQRELPAVEHVKNGAARVEYHRGNVVEWYDNGELGLEQGFTLEAPPAGEGQLELAIEVAGGLEAVERGNTVELLGADDRAVLRVSELYAADATGRSLPAEMALEGDQIVLRVDDHDAQYPIDVDPLVAKLQSFVIGSNLGGTFAFATSIDGSTAVVGAPSQDNGVGAAYVFTRSGSTWSEQTKLIPQYVGNPPAATSRIFGYAVAVSGNTIAIGAPATSQNTQGRVHVYTRSNSQWTLQATPSPVDTWVDGNDGFGTSVALEGNELVVGAPLGEMATGGNPDVAELVDVGVAFRFTRSGSTWSRNGSIPHTGFPDRFSRTLALQLPTLAIGSVDRVYTYNLVNNAWAQTQVLSAPSSGTDFGSHLAIADVSSTTTGTLIVAESGATTSRGTRSGAARVFTRSNSATWSSQAQLVPSTATTDTRYGVVALAVNTASGRLVAAIAAPQRSASIAIFSRSGTTWSERSTIPGVSPANPSFGFGYSLDMDSTTLAVGYVLDPFFGGSEGFYRVGAGDGDSCTSSSQCASGFCADGVCCDAACDGGTSDCRACSTAAGSTENGKCTMRARNTVCRGSAGTCDVAEVCNGTNHSCPSDVRRPSSFQCRAGNGQCNAAEFCSGGVSCPSDRMAPSGTVCRAASTSCDIAETCNGTSASCPTTDAVHPWGRVCLTGASACDPNDLCNGVDKVCAPVNFCF